jgi:hypothetical protein
MKKLLLLPILMVVLFSCKKTHMGDPSTTPPDGSTTPAAAVGDWLYGTFSMTEFWAYDGSYLGNAFELSVAFTFNADGSYEEFFISQANNYGCSTQALSYYKGYVTFTDSSFTTHPVQGEYKGFYSCLPSSNFDRDALESELEVQTYYYTFETDSNGKKWMVVRFNPDDEYPTYFAAENW